MNDDIVLRPGDMTSLAFPGTAIALAHEAARVVLEVPDGIDPPRAVEVAARESEPGRRLDFRAPSLVGATVALVKAAAASILARLRGGTLRWNACAPDALRFEPMTRADGSLPRMRRGEPPRAHLATAIFDEWMTWRM